MGKKAKKCKQLREMAHFFFERVRPSKSCQRQIGEDPTNPFILFFFFPVIEKTLPDTRRLRHVGPSRCNVGAAGAKTQQSGPVGRTVGQTETRRNFPPNFGPRLGPSKSTANVGQVEIASEVYQQLGRTRFVDHLQRYHLRGKVEGER